MTNVWIFNSYTDLDIKAQSKKLNYRTRFFNTHLDFPYKYKMSENTLSNFGKVHALFLGKIVLTWPRHPRFVHIRIEFIWTLSRSENSPISVQIFAVFYNQSSFGLDFVYFSLVEKTRLVRTDPTPNFKVNNHEI